MDRQCIHVGAQPNTARTVAFALDHTHDPGLADACMHLVHTHIAQLLRHDPSGPRFQEPNFGMRMQILENLGQLVGAVLDDGQDVHIQFAFSKAQPTPGSVFECAGCQF